MIPYSHEHLQDRPFPASARRESTATVSSTPSTATSSRSSVSGSLCFVSEPPFSPSLSPSLFPSPSTSASVSLASRPREGSLNDEVARLPLNPAVTVSFVRSSRLFKLRYTFINIRKDFAGALKCLELGGAVGQQTAFLHSFNTTRLPVPHLEHPITSSEPYTPSSLRISFLDEQTVQTGATVFATQLSYTFESWLDCLQFQELILASRIVFIAGIAEAKSKGRGEECISQNLRILRQDHTGKLVMLFFANSQRKERKRYVSIPLNHIHYGLRADYSRWHLVSCIESVMPGKNSRRPVVLQLQPNFDHLAQMRTLQISFLDSDDKKAFCEFLAANNR
ncbi:predicted protein [Aspergillus nidulans FGSC A4]|uniref:Uncharacterized protein n=1 Tax=Emericella nidulans (strain FGSC A4 / ATCC 38163 / CBS 112.46 / NRRL 194 / M139) TaxID=227321 RepID=Q5BCW7_EMENI|nr:hypothetical protein [Aspergillus nidulans FGSC A4]EAA64733.1 predicted protein [Aspergillus nidulans FGSC A4]CBF85223.1 TPA: conserved hypothetical protein [Aspergillus nidulans FGSC A4]|eukprot:XP_659217.1 predicted protein [Aspergillus nidulans FGSC A4]